MIYSASSVTVCIKGVAIAEASDVRVEPVRGTVEMPRYPHRNRAQRRADARANGSLRR